MMETINNYYYFFLSHYISLPQLAFSCMLKSTGVVIECLTDADMIFFLESNIRGGVSFINQRHCTASTTTKEMHASASIDPLLFQEESFASPSKEHEQMLYIDANNLYGVRTNYLA
jgi:hypothetical protein